MVRWIAAYQNFALAAAAAATEVRFTQSLFHVKFKTQAFLAWQVWPYTAAMAHLRICMEIATSSVSENRRHVLAQIYDELCRREWSERALRGRKCCAHSPPHFPFWSWVAASQKPGWVRPRQVPTVHQLRAGDQSFSIEAASKRKDLETLERARRQFDCSNSGHHAEERNKRAVKKGAATCSGGGVHVLIPTPPCTPAWAL